MEIYKILFKYQKEGVKLSKTADNPFFKSKYLPLDDILEYFIPKFSEDGILCIHSIENKELVTKLIFLEKNEIIESRFPLHNTDPQKQGSEITYGKRYNLSALLNIQTDEDDDGNKASGNKIENESKEKKWYNNTPKNISVWSDAVAKGKTTGKEILDKIYADGYSINSKDKETILNLDKG